MQSGLHTVSNTSPQFHLSWASHKTKVSTPKTANLVNPRNPLKPFATFNSLKTSFNSKSDSHFTEENLKNPEQDQGISYSLPIVIRNSGNVSRYIWDGNGLKLVSLNGNSFSLSDFFLDFEDGVRKLVRIWGSAFRNFFLPREVRGNYLEYVKWKFLHRVSSSALQVLATQAMFRAIGIGFTRSLPSAAALNWVLKDGLGRLSRCLYTASLASVFDTNLKRVRFSTSVLFSLSIGVELLTPAFPQYFLLLASIGNIAKQISLACYLATGTAVHRSFAIADNLGEVSAKAQIQTVCFDNLGLLVAAILNFALKNNQRLQAALPFLVYPIFSAFDLYGIYQGLKHVHLQTLTKDRLEIIINVWIQQGYVPSPAEVSKEEGIDFLWSKGRKPWPIKIGCLDPRNQLPKLSMLTMQTLNKEDFYFICMESFNSGSAKIGQYGIILCLREGASSLDVIMGLFQACYIRKGLLLSNSLCETSFEACDCSYAVQEWLKLTEECKSLAQVNLQPLNEEMLKVGWACKNVLLSAQEQARYGFIAG